MLERRAVLHVVYNTLIIIIMIIKRIQKTALSNFSPPADANAPTRKSPPESPPAAIPTKNSVIQEKYHGVFYCKEYIYIRTSHCVPTTIVRTLKRTKNKNRKKNKKKKKMKKKGKQQENQ